MVSALSTSETYLLLSLLAACFTITCGDFVGEGDRFQRKQNLDPFFPTTAHFARIFSTVVLSDFEIRTSDLRLRRARSVVCKV